MNPDVLITEVGPRDGLQNESIPISTEIKARFVENLFAAGLGQVEATSFVSPKWVPQLADAAELLEAVKPDLDRIMVLVPNQKGLERALASGVKQIALFTAASDAFTLKNINKTVAESLAEFAQLIPQFRQAVPDGKVRCYVSTVVECPYAGKVEPDKVAEIVKQVHQMGVDEISLGETIGTAVPQEVRLVAEEVEAVVPFKDIVWHFHDTRGTGMANVIAMLERGYRRFDSSAGGIGGCPYAPGAGGNVATEDLVYACERMGLATGVDLPSLARASLPVLQALGRIPTGKAQKAALSAC